MTHTIVTIMAYINCALIVFPSDIYVSIDVCIKLSHANANKNENPPITDVIINALGAVVDDADVEDISFFLYIKYIKKYVKIYD